MAEGRTTRRRGLARGEILACALAIVDEEGLDALSFRALGARLGVSQTAFYRHVPDKAALLDGIAEEVWREVFSTFDASVAQSRAGDWRDVALLYCRTLLGVLRAHPSSAVLMLTHPISTPGQFSLVARSLASLASAGIEPPDDVPGLLCALTVYTTGFAAAELAPPAGGAAAQPGTGLEDALSGLDEDGRAALGRLVAPLRAEGWRLADQFETGLRALLCGWGTPDRSHDGA